jgi:alginate O-acetyltransferase complex protein AlgI
MLVIALWHEISFRYVVWGLYNGLGIVGWQQFQRVKPLLPRIGSSGVSRALGGVSVLITFHFVIFGFVLVNQPTLGQALAVYRSMFEGWR